MKALKSLLFLLLLSNIGFAQAPPFATMIANFRAANTINFMRDTGDDMVSCYSSGWELDTLAAHELMLWNAVGAVNSLQGILNFSNVATSFGGGTSDFTLQDVSAGAAYNGHYGSNDLHFSYGGSPLIGIAPSHTSFNSQMYFRDNNSVNSVTISAPPFLTGYRNITWPDEDGSVVLHSTNRAINVTGGAGASEMAQNAFVLEDLSHTIKTELAVVSGIPVFSMQDPSTGFNNVMISSGLPFGVVDTFPKAPGRFALTSDIAAGLLTVGLPQVLAVKDTANSPIVLKSSTLINVISQGSDFIADNVGNNTTIHPYETDINYTSSNSNVIQNFQVTRNQLNFASQNVSMGTAIDQFIVPADTLTGQFLSYFDTLPHKSGKFAMLSDLASVSAVGLNGWAQYYMNGVLMASPGFVYDTVHSIGRFGMGFKTFNATGFVFDKTAQADTFYGAGGYYFPNVGVNTPTNMACFDVHGQLIEEPLPVTSITAGTGLSGGTITTTGTISMPNVGTAGTYGSSTLIPIITTDAQGRVSAVTTASVASTPPGSDKWLAYNNSGAWGADAYLQRDPATGAFIEGASGGPIYIDIDAAAGEYVFGSQGAAGDNMTIDNIGHTAQFTSNALGSGVVIPMTYGASGQYWSSNGAGIMSWTNPVVPVNVTLTGINGQLVYTASIPSTYTIAYGCQIIGTARVAGLDAPFSSTNASISVAAAKIASAGTLTIVFSDQVSGTPTIKVGCLMQ